MSNSTTYPHDPTPEQAAVEVGVTRRTIDRWIRSGHLKAYRVGPKLIRIPAAELDRLRREI